MKKVYVGCALTNASAEYRQYVSDTKERLREIVEVIDFKGLYPGEGDWDNPEGVVEYDLGCVRACDMMLGFCDYPSTGMGMEIGLANSLGKPVLLVGQDNSPTNMVKGIRAENPKGLFTTYDSVDDLIDKIQKFIADMD